MSALITKRSLASMACIAALLMPLTSIAQVEIKTETDLPKEEKLWSMADRYWGEEAMEKAREEVLAGNGDFKTSMLLFDRLEWQDTGGDGTLLWDFQGWYGGDIDKLYIKSEGEVSLEDDEIEGVEVQALWSRAVAPFWDLQAGVRYDLEPKGRTHAVVGVQGLAPYWFEVDAAAFLSTDGDVSARIEAEYELRFSQRLVLQPRIEANVSAQDIPELGIGSGLTEIEPGLRLRYEVRRTFAPYVGVEWQKKFGDTADFTRANNEDTNKIVGVIGLRTWF